jgi:riboflavin kinase/FMN adenylyltransferase
MKVYRNPKQLASLHRPLFLTNGTFDGVHRGHLKVLQDLKKRARLKKGLSCVLTFKTHPYQVLHPVKRPQLLTSTLHKLLLMDRAGVEACLLLDFTEEFSHQTPEAFVRDFLVKKLKVLEIHLGYKSRFGFHRTGDTEHMARLAARYGFIFKETPPFKEAGVPLSSTGIRELIQKGDLKRASRFLGRPYSILGTTVKGKGLGKRLGYPTANLDIRSEIVPPRGVYAVTVNILKFKDWIIQHGSTLDARPEASGLRGILNLGYRPTVDPQSKELVPEVHLLDFHKNLYGRVLEVTFHAKIRKEIRFDSLTALRQQIALDQKKAEKILAN